MQKAMREAKLHTSWVANNEPYESAVNTYIDAVLSDTAFVADMSSFVEKIIHAGRVNSLAQTLMKQTAPGVPDLYQGSELWDLSLVDPDNRRPVDYDLRRRLLAEAETLDAAQVLARMEEGLPKLWLIYRTLHLREQHSESFCRYASYAPLHAAGDNAEHVVAYLRDDKILTIVPRWTTTLGGKWGDTTLEVPAGTWTNELTGERIEAGVASVESLLREFPVALLAREN
jgi:(1->4)-alpha-D-glucan 1-alpha-D-glucosylmutase